MMMCFVSNNLRLLTSLCNSPPLHQVAQYIKFEMPVLQSFITKLKEEEDREVQKLRKRYKKHIFHQSLSYFCLPQKNFDTGASVFTRIIYKHVFADLNMLSVSLYFACICRYTYLRCIIEKQLSCLPEGATCMWAAHQNVNPPPPPQNHMWQRQWLRIIWQKPKVCISAVLLLLCVPASAWKLSNQSTKLKTVHVRCDCVSLRIHDGSCSLVQSNHFIPLCLYLFHHTWCTQKASLLLPSRMSLKWDVLCSVSSPVYNPMPQIEVKHKHQIVLS